MGLVTDQVVVVQANRPPVLDDGTRGAAHGGDPLGQLGRVADGRREADQAHPHRQVDDHFLPNRSAVGVLQEVHFVEHHYRQVAQRRAAGVDHVAQHFCGHHHHGCVSVDGVVAGEQTHLLRPQALDQVVVLLVGERLHRRRVEGSLAVGHRRVDRVLGDHRLAASRRGGHQHGFAVVERVESP